MMKAWKLSLALVVLLAASATARLGGHAKSFLIEDEGLDATVVENGDLERELEEQQQRMLEHHRHRHRHRHKNDEGEDEDEAERRGHLGKFPKHRFKAKAPPIVKAAKKGPGAVMEAIEEEMEIAEAVEEEEIEEEEEEESSGGEGSGRGKGHKHGHDKEHKLDGNSTDTSSNTTSTEEVPTEEARNNDGLVAHGFESYAHHAVGHGVGKKAEEIEMQVVTFLEGKEPELLEELRVREKAYKEAKRSLKHIVAEIVALVGTDGTKLVEQEVIHDIMVEADIMAHAEIDGNFNETRA
ncbi:expressed unknown protein [Seminavis robusta]|uniref:Uncharacterized protein n=1 Tax=Seminavis robusta TaxID=568900 RepID=A0A9N8HPM2_9STRA|nr:expressed unknown protein [Seminavis robusta]|eukprot:Sro1104_g241820.1 n/a (296) ;mRNA; r:18227-19114